MHKVDVLAREMHHLEHALAIYNKLDSKIKGSIFFNEYALSKSKNEYCAVFSYGDLKLAHKYKKKIIFGDHGAGMYYNTPHPSYAGSDSFRERVVLRLSPNVQHATKEKEILDCEVKIIGIPALDEWAKNREINEKKLKRRGQRKPVVALSFHWDCKVCPETRSAYAEYVDILKELTKHVVILGHGHPRIIDKLRPIYKDARIEVVDDFRIVMERADMYVCDNSSTIYEFAYLNKPVVLINSNHYRRDYHHEGNPRFWKYADIGPQVNRPTDLVKGIAHAWEHYEKYLPYIKRATDAVCTFTDGNSSQRAADTILDFMKTQ